MCTTDQQGTYSQLDYHIYCLGGSSSDYSGLLDSDLIAFNFKISGLQLLALCLQVYSVAVSVFLGGSKPSRVENVRGDVAVGFSCDPDSAWKLVCILFLMLGFRLTKSEKGAFGSACVQTVIDHGMIKFWCAAGVYCLV